MKSSAPAFWLAKKGSKLCPNRDTLTCSYQTRSGQSHKQAIQAQHHGPVGPLPFVAVSSRSKRYTPFLFFRTSLPAAVNDAELHTDRWYPIFAPKLQNRTSSTIPFFSNLFDNQSLTSTAQINALPSTPSMEPFTKTAFSSATAPSSQQTPKTSVSTFSSQKPSYSNKASPTPTTSAGGEVPLSPLSHQPHPAPLISRRHPQAQFHFPATAA